MQKWVKILAWWTSKSPLNQCSFIIQPNLKKKNWVPTHPHITNNGYPQGSPEALPWLPLGSHRCFQEWLKCFFQMCWRYSHVSNLLILIFSRSSKCRSVWSIWGLLCRNLHGRTPSQYGRTSCQKEPLNYFCKRRAPGCFGDLNQSKQKLDSKHTPKNWWLVNGT